jgi:biopolymer transport protein ExbD
MNLRPRRRLEPEINLIPLIDILLVIILFFTVSSSLQKPSRLRIDLPEAARQAGPAGPVPQLEVAIDAASRFYVNGQPLPDSRPTTLRDAVIQAASNRRDQPLLIRADARTPHQAVVTAMDVVGRLGFRQLVIPTLPAVEQAPPVGRQ